MIDNAAVNIFICVLMHINMHFWRKSTYKWNFWVIGCVYLALLDIAKLFPKVALSVYSLTSSVCKFPLLHCSTSLPTLGIFQL